MKKLTIKVALPGLKVTSLTGLRGICLIDNKYVSIEENSTITIIEKPKRNYSETVITFSVGEKKYTENWLDFKKYTYTDDVLIAPEKSWTEKQEKRLAPRGYYLSVYGKKGSCVPNMTSIDYIGKGKCQYFRLDHGSQWNTLSWVSAVTKNKLKKESTLKDNEDGYRYDFCHTFDEVVNLMKERGYRTIPSEAADKKEDAEMINLIRAKKFDKILN